MPFCCSYVLDLFSFYRSSAIIPLIPLGLKETKDVDFSVPFKVCFFFVCFSFPLAKLSKINSFVLRKYSMMKVYDAV